MASRADLEEQAAAQAAVVAAVWAQLQAGWAQLGLTSAAVQTPAGIAAVQQLLGDLISAWGEVAATLAADFYDTLREQAGVPGGFTATVPDPLNQAQVDGIVRWALDPSPQAITTSLGYDPSSGEHRGTSTRLPDKLNVAAMLAKLEGPTQRLIRQSQRAALEESARRDPVGRVRVARIPMGAETCAFCLVMASRGYIYRSEASAGRDNSFHDFCDCEQDVAFGTPEPPEGYDPGELYGKYDDARRAAGSADLRKVLKQLRLQEGIR